LQSVDISTTAADPPSLPMSGAWGTIRSYILWQHERGTLHYDIMVTLILIFVFFSPRVLNFNDKPAVPNTHPAGVFVTSDGNGGLVYRIEASTVSASNDAAVRDQLLHTIEPISGKVSIVKYETVKDGQGRAQEYQVWVKREQ
jgi:hypothetical protein